MSRPIAIVLRLSIVLSAMLLLRALLGHAHAQETNEYPAASQPGLPLQRLPPPGDFTAGSPSTAARISPDYRFGPGDRLRVTVFGQNDLTGEYPVDGSGNIRLPLVGQIRAAGLTAPVLEAAIVASLDHGYLVEPKVAVEIAAYRPFYIIGAVNRPGEYPYVNAMTALNAVALAGGYLPSAVESIVYIRHEGELREQKVETSRMIRIRPGDVVRIDTTIFFDAMNLLSPLATPLAIAAATIR